MQEYVCSGRKVKQILKVIYCKTELQINLSRSIINLVLQYFQPASSITLV
jgi:hypothetical protein